jgi:hypothetical protein
LQNGTDFTGRKAFHACQSHRKFSEGITVCAGPPITFLTYNFPRT